MGLKIAFLGPEGTYTHQAVVQQFGKNNDKVQIYAQKSISECFEALDTNQVNYAVVPFENSTNGQVVYTYDLIRDWFLPSSSQGKQDQDQRKAGFKVVGEQFVAIHHNFLTRASDIELVKRVYSHPQVWGQVSYFMTSKVPEGVVTIDCGSTAKAAECVTQDESRTSACISSKMSAELYQLPVLFEGIENNQENTTRFLVLGYEDLPRDVDVDVKLEQKDKLFVTSVIFTLNDDPGALCTALNSFKKHGVNLTSINSRPSQTGKWQYVFFIEIIGSTNDDAVQASLTEFSASCLDMITLGSFQRSCY